MLDFYPTKGAFLFAILAGLITYKTLPQTGNVTGFVTLIAALVAGFLVWVVAYIIIERLNNLRPR